MYFFRQGLAQRGLTVLWPSTIQIHDEGIDRAQRITLEVFVSNCGTALFVTSGDLQIVPAGNVD
jgi:hypothetical protein